MHLEVFDFLQHARLDRHLASHTREQTWPGLKDDISFAAEWVGDSVGTHGAEEYRAFISLDTHVTELAAADLLWLRSRLDGICLA